MKIIKNAHLELRALYNEEVRLCRAANAHARQTIEFGRSLLPTDRNGGMDQIQRGIWLRGEGNRELCLALAFLNNTPYSACEAKPEKTPYYASIAKYIAPCLEGCTQEKALDAIRTWTKSVVLRRIDILPIASESQASEPHAQAS